MTDEFSQLWTRIETLERAVAVLIDVQQQKLASTTAATDGNVTTAMKAQLSEIKASLAGSSSRQETPAEINVGRINVREPDGTLRVAISN